MPRLIMLAAIAAIVYFLYQRYFNTGGFKRCGRCDGKGYWHNAYQRVTCDYCNGSGKLPR
ncbi:MAG: hypothetical protein KDC92_02705 [Bacteroidetes bacterium]|nr:hypothetical protein [Bacteroidota bacterium]